MHVWRKSFFIKKSVAWLLLVAVAMLSLFPAHTHIHHEDDISAPSHVASQTHNHHTSAIHAISDTTGHSEHSEHEGDTVLPASSDTIIKKVNFNPLLIAVFIGFIVFLSLAFSSHKLRQLVSTRLHKLHIYISPPLRAPPLY
jgi:predicted permease